MAIPDFQAILLPLLRFAADDIEHSLREAIEHLAGQFGLADSERKELLPSGQPRFDNRVAWARAHLFKAGLLESTRRGHFRLTARGREVLARHPSALSMKDLERFPEYAQFRGRQSKPEDGSPSKPEDATWAASGADAWQTPIEQLEAAHQKLCEELAAELLQRVRQCSPPFFERLVVDVLVKMGYGGSRQEAGKAIGRSGDEGIDGLISEDRLGLDVIYLQAKRWQEAVGRPEVQKFAGALQGCRARKGVLITTSAFTREARDYVEKIEAKIVLIDGAQLVRLMMDHNVGVSLAQVYEIKKLDSDYFEEE